MVPVRHRSRRNRKCLRAGNTPITARPVSWWTHRQTRLVLPRLSDHIRADVGLPCHKRLWWSELWFIATPARIGWASRQNK